MKYTLKYIIHGKKDMYCVESTFDTFEEAIKECSALVGGCDAWIVPTPETIYTTNTYRELEV